MIKWLRKKLGILSLATRVENLEKDILRIYKSQNTIENKTHTLENKTRNRPQRFDQIERARKRRYKDSA